MTSNASPQWPQRNGAQRPAAATNSSSERQATTSSAIKEERRPTLSDLPKIAKRTSVASPQSPPQDEPTAGTGTPPERPPKWYADLKVKNARDKNFSNADTLLGRLSDDIRKCRTAGSGNRVPIFDKIRELLHIIVFVEVTPDLLKAKHMLENNGALAKLFDDQRSDGVNWPFDIKADARELYNKWCDRVFETDLLRGIKFHVKSVNDKKEGQKTTDSLDRTYPTTRSNYHGNGKLLNGQWWPLQICALRDGAHGSSQGGIHGRNDDCAYSVIMSGGTDSTGKKYPDVDDGDEVLYCGTDSVNGKIAEATSHLIRSAEKKKPVRLLRSSNLGSQYAPEAGFRYDGLYDVVSFENLDGPESMRQRHQFKLKRQAGQDPIRALGPERRPTQQELDEYKKHKRLAGKIKGQV
ncbi:PUA-like domain-containing protein [Neohortaea acidophila]|uniref:PUA-like domain-containing protein n=1 Tax=Neohortaea acidophila TaxID=245834 RepID=A0A6A6PW06_9PEZI|nr:PUA-like domain-containing protein [Neohortaea acidophila]KAF2483477.1 PUA-like domain-containing protein [Neohortaea acidophila]